MRNFIKINILIPILIIVLQQYVVAQFSCNVEYHPNFQIRKCDCDLQIFHLIVFHGKQEKLWVPRSG